MRLGLVLDEYFAGGWIVLGWWLRWGSGLLIQFRLWEYRYGRSISSPRIYAS
jgi:hypothetical protein